MKRRHEPVVEYRHKPRIDCPNRVDCPHEPDHVWECCNEFDLCIWCMAEVKCRHGRKRP